MLDFDSPLTDPCFTKRLLSGSALVLFQYDESGSTDTSKSQKSFVEKLAAHYPDLQILVLPEAGNRDPLELRKALLGIKNKSAAGLPCLILVAGTLEGYISRGAEALAPSNSIEEVLLADTLITGVLPCALIIDSAAKYSHGPRQDLLPMTPIEEKLLGSMESAGLTVACQISFDEYVVDFLVSNSSNRIVVEADGAAFHDYLRDKERDRILFERHDLRVVVPVGQVAVDGLP